jgi:hypothetical protein
MMRSSKNEHSLINEFEVQITKQCCLTEVLRNAIRCISFYHMYRDIARFDYISMDPMFLQQTFLISTICIQDYRSYVQWSESIRDWDIIIKLARYAE